jgi:hypothetical protein
MDLTKETLAQLVAAGKNFRQVAQETGKTLPEVLKLARENNIQRPVKPLPVEEAYGKYVGGSTLLALRDLYGVPIPRIIREILAAHPDFKLRAEDEARRQQFQGQGQGGQAKPLPVEEMVAKYQSGKGVDALAAEYGVPIQRVMRRILRSNPNFAFRAEDEAKKGQLNFRPFQNGPRKIK